MISQTLTDSFKAQLLRATHDFREAEGDTFKLALYTANADLGAATTQYTTTGEVVGAGYVAGGAVLTRRGVVVENGVAFVRFDNLSFPGATFTARGALIYNTTPSTTGGGGIPLVDPSVAVLDFGADRSASNSTFTIQSPAWTPTTAISRIA